MKRPAARRPKGAAAPAPTARRPKGSTPAPASPPADAPAPANNRDERRGERRGRDRRADDRRAGDRRAGRKPPAPPPSGPRQGGEETSPASGPRDTRPTIRYVVGELPRIVQETLSALRADENLFQAAGRLMTVVREPGWGWMEPMGPELCERRASLDVACSSCAAEPGSFCVREHRAGSTMRRAPGTARMTVLAPAVLTERMATVAAWTRFDKDGEEIPANPPKPIVDIVHQREEYPAIPPIRGVIEAPALRPDGTVITEPGYDRATGYYYAPSGDFPAIPERPTRADAVAAMRRLWIEMFCDFPYRNMPEPDPSDHDRSRRYAHALGCPDAFVGIAALLSILARPAIRGAVPSCAFEAAAQGSGKTKQIHAVATIATGRAAGVATFPMRNGRANDEELEKVLAGYALGGASIVAFDNVRGTLGGSALEKAQTAEDTIDLRVLGFTGQKTLPWTPLLMVTGNNMAMTSDTADRTLISRLESSREDPRSRPPSEFRHSNLLAALRARRPALLRDALIILRAYAIATVEEKNAIGRECGTLGSFESWSALIPRVIRYAGGPNVLDARQRADASDGEGGAHEALMRHWPSCFDETGVRASELIRTAFQHEAEILRNNHEPDGYDELRGAIRELTTTAAGKIPNPVAFGNDVLRGLRGKWRDGMKLVGERDRKGITLWRVERRDPTRPPNPPPPRPPSAPPPPPTPPPSSSADDAGDDIERDAIQGEPGALDGAHGPELDASGLDVGQADDHQADDHQGEHPALDVGHDADRHLAAPAPAPVSRTAPPPYHGVIPQGPACVTPAPLDHPAPELAALAAHRPETGTANAEPSPAAPAPASVPGAFPAFTAPETPVNAPQAAGTGDRPNRRPRKPPRPK